MSFELRNIRELDSMYLKITLPDLPNDSLRYVNNVYDVILKEINIKPYLGEHLLFTRTISGEDRYLYRELYTPHLSEGSEHIQKLYPGNVAKDFEILYLFVPTCTDEPLKIIVDITLATPSAYVLIMDNSVNLANITLKTPTVTLLVTRDTVEVE